MENTTYTREHNYGLRTWGEGVWHIVGKCSERPHAKAACGLRRVAQRTGGRPTWADNRTLPPEVTGQLTCPECEYAISLQKANAAMAKLQAAYS